MFVTWLFFYFRLETSDILIKGGEWKLGIDEEPLPFQIVKVSAIIRHPEYKVGSLQNDLAVLVLQEKLRESKNIGTICLPEPNQIPTQDCVATGWGKRILQCNWIINLLNLNYTNCYFFLQYMQRMHLCIE